MDVDRGVVLPHWGVRSQGRGTSLFPAPPGEAARSSHPSALRRDSLSLTEGGVPPSPPQARCLRPVVLGLGSPLQRVNGMLVISTSAQSFVGGFLLSHSFVSRGGLGRSLNAPIMIQHRPVSPVQQHHTF